MYENKTIPILLMTGIISVSSFFSVMSAASTILPYREAKVENTAILNNHNYVIPLSKIQRAGRGWAPEKVLDVDAQVTRFTFKVPRSSDLDEVYRFYLNQIKQADTNVIFECNSRSCGSSNAWANNFFNDYRLYGADDNQSLIVLQNNQLYYVMYINRRGAGDVMVRIDQVSPIVGAMINPFFEQQLSVLEIPKIRRFIEDKVAGERYFAVVTADAGSPVESFEKASAYIDEVKLGLGQRLKTDIEFINLGRSDLETYGESKITFIKR
ncbi:DUF4892 domain-containing protein [Marinomonas algicola]|uniref:DUF4892 domain-containing protein n=1 Tax=Marinomonas algicola TaxID=2773454 RepID=UPI0017487394|nr:DUF4892 domain-containing protein [Marinomonas algicola]